ncbi:sugar-binding transcriptional regulator [Paracoccus spongiarum]|uniref:Sugar-binding domain-containing protein n=1 Tax=Paracoccus spongiarum TaxID=3064387 RepID=A0ABT9JEV5_9RHOB|nr:sugar-binding domain-containing protein [Paracoccus sp. 2205BS29-5]MDP5308358.1 sugar-binding domain-containing protein [Paracoccus sp. 2205BS29-5]
MPQARDTQDDSDAFAVEVCWHYYVNGMTQAEIASQMDATRLRVNQAIQRAKSLGIVRVEIDSPFAARFELQEALRRELGLRRVIIAPARRDPHDYHGPVGAALAIFLTESLRNRRWSSIGVSWGMTLDQAVRRLPPQSWPDLEIVSMMGGTMKGASFNSFSIASGFAGALGASYALLAAPIFLSEGVDRARFLAQDNFLQHFDRFRRLDAAILTASDVSGRSFLVANGMPHEGSADELIAAGAIGDVLGRFLDRDGNAVDHPLSGRTIGVEIETLMAVPEKILAAAGPHKVRIIRAASRRGLVDTLVTDDVTAELILQDGAADPAPSASPGGMT